MEQVIYFFISMAVFISISIALYNIAEIKEYSKKQYLITKEIAELNGVSADKIDKINDYASYLKKNKHTFKKAARKI